MYKKTTTIIEEHSEPLSKGVFNNISNENTDLGISIKINNRHYYSLYVMYLGEYLNTVYNKWPTTNIKNKITAHSTSGFLWVMSPWAGPVLAPTAGLLDTVVASMGAMTNDFCGVIDAILGGKDRDAAIATSKKSMSAFASNLNALIYLLQQDKVLVIWERYLDCIVSQSDNKMAGEWQLESDKFYNGYSIIASEYSTGTPPFSDAMTNGLIQWQPLRFNT